MARQPKKSATAAKQDANAAMAELSGFFDRAKAVARKLDAGQKIDGGRLVAISARKKAG